MAIRVSHSSSSSLRRPLKSSRSLAAPTTTPASANVPFVYFVLLLSTLLVTAGPLSVVNGLPTQQQQQQQQEKYGRSSAAAEQNLAEQMILAEPPQLQVGKPSPYDLEMGGNDILLPPPDLSAMDQAAAADRAKLLSKIMTLVLEGKRLPPHIVSRFSPRALSLLSASSSSYTSSPSSPSSSASGLQHKRQIRYQQCYFNPISCFK
ncbi:hypothetical protein TYRP_002363 [Tyrophagus putrescentiae]|nr:hypothetical protein TYRP_002363 [Tyrophagus putrescentiae]